MRLLTELAGQQVVDHVFWRTRVDILFLSENEVQQLLDIDELLEGLAEGFKALSEGKVVAPSRNEVAVPNAGSMLAMPAWFPSEHITVKLVTIFHSNLELGIPGHQALICLFDHETGTPLAVMDGTYITAMRTAGATALSTRLLARQDSSVLAIIGAGAQGHSHLKILPQVRTFNEIRVASLYFTDAQKLAATNSKVQPIESIEEAVRGADVVCLCTASETPVISLDWLSSGSHITSVGYRPPGGELPRQVAEYGKLFVETRLAFKPQPAGCGDLAGLDPAIATELGEILLGKHPGRQSEQEITVYKSMGHAMEDMVAANLVYQRARQQAIGVNVKL
jgi:ornithine cyclodeaminase/thiomorpholine-carboxylate dehydrogenase